MTMPASSPSPKFPKGLLPELIPAGSSFVRIHWKTNGAVFFGPQPGFTPANRFDAPAGEYRVLYGALDVAGAYIETVLRRPGRILRRADAYGRAATRLEVQRPLTLAKLFDEGLYWHGTHAGELGADDYPASRRLALDLHQDFPALDGLAYRSRFNNGQICYALFDRVAAADLVSQGSTDFATHPTLVDSLMSLYGAVFDTSSPP